MSYKMYGIMHNLCSIKTNYYATNFNYNVGKHQMNWSVKHFISVPSMALYSARN